MRAARHGRSMEEEARTILRKAWMRPNPGAIAITAMNEAEVLHGLDRLPGGRRERMGKPMAAAPPPAAAWRRETWTTLTTSAFGSSIPGRCPLDAIHARHPIEAERLPNWKRLSSP